MKKKSILFLLLSLMLIVTACNSNSGGDSSSKKVDQITVWAWDANFNIKALNIANSYYIKEDAEFKINIVENSQDDVIQKMNTGLASGTTAGLPNIVLIEDYRAQGFLQSYPDMFFPLTDYFKVDDFAEYKIGPTSYDGKNYGIPFDSGVTGLYVRTDYLEQAGYTIDDLQNITWNEYIEIGKAVKEKTGKHMLALDPSDLGIIRVMIQTAGSWFTKEDGVTPNLAGNEALAEALEVYKEIMKADIVKLASDWSEYVAAFNDGSVASVPTGNWISASVKANADQAGKWAVAPIPRLANQANSANASNLGGSSWYVLNIAGAEQAAKFLQSTFGSNVDFYQELVTEIGAIGTYKPASEGEVYQSADEFYQGQKVFEDLAEWTANIPRVNYGMHTYAIADILVVELQNYLNDKDLNQVLADAQAQAESQLK